MMVGRRLRGVGFGATGRGLAGLVGVGDVAAIGSAAARDGVYRSRPVLALSPSRLAAPPARSR